MIPRTAKLCVITACYGERHRPFLGALLESLEEDGQRPAEVCVINDGIPWLKKYPAVWSPSFTWTPTGERVQRVDAKERAWARALEEIEPGRDVVFLDADTIVESSLAPAFEPAFDVATTPGPYWPLNTGVVFVKNLNGPQREFVNAWAWLNDWMAESAEAPKIRGRWGAVGQASFAAAATLFSGREPLTFELLPRIWNATTCDIQGPVIRHLKGLLPYLLGEKAFAPGDEHHGHDHTELFERWRTLYRRHQERIQ